MVLFSHALLISAFTLFPIFLILTYYSKEHIAELPKLRLFWVPSLGFILLSIYFIADSFTRTVRSETYFIFITAFALYILVSLIFASDNRKNKAMLLGLVITLHLVSIISLFAVSKIVIDERSWALNSILSRGYWIFDGSRINEFYKMFPLDLGLFSIISEITGVTFTSTLLYLAYASASMLVFDLLTYTLSQHFGAGWRGGIFTILLAVASPLLVWTSGYAHYSLAFIAIILFLTFVEGDRVSKLSMGVLVGVAGIVLHVMLPATIIWLLLTLVLVKPFLNFFGYDFKNYDLNLLIILLVITFLRWVFVESHFDRIMSSIVQFIWNVILMRGVGSLSPSEEIRYNQFASPLFAYAWALPVVFIAAHLTMQVSDIIRHKNVFASPFFVMLSVAGLSMTGVTFSMQVIGGSDAFTPRLIVPAYAMMFLALGKVGTSMLRSKKIAILVLVALLIPYFSIAFMDPRKASDTTDQLVYRLIRLDEFQQVRTLMRFLPSVEENSRLIVTHIHLSNGFNSDFWTKKMFQTTVREDSITRALINYSKLGISKFEYYNPFFIKIILLDSVMFVRKIADVEGSIKENYNIGYNSGNLVTYWYGPI